MILVKNKLIEILDQPPKKKIVKWLADIIRCMYSDK